jgi:hypothetical protein
LYILIAQVRDWKALQRLNRSTLLEFARQAGAIRFRVYRNVRDASQGLLVAELPDYATARDLSERIGAELDAPGDGDLSIERVWQPTELDGIG